MDAIYSMSCPRWMQFPPMLLYVYTVYKKKHVRVLPGDTAASSDILRTSVPPLGGCTEHNIVPDTCSCLVIIASFLHGAPRLNHHAAAGATDLVVVVVLYPRLSGPGYIIKSDPGRKAGFSF